MTNNKKIRHLIFSLLHVFQGPAAQKKHPEKPWGRGDMREDVPLEVRING